MNVVASAATKDINSTLNVTSGAKSATVGAVLFDAITTSTDSDLTANVVLSGGAGTLTTGAIEFRGGDAAANTFAASLSAIATDATVTIGEIKVDERDVATAGAVTNIGLVAAGGDVTLNTLTLTDTTKANLTVEAAVNDTVTVETLAGTSNLSTVTALGAGTISLFSEGTSSAVVGGTIVDTTGATGNVTVDLASAGAGVVVYLGNAATDKVNTILTGSGIDTVYGGTGADSIDGGSAADIISTAQGNDTLIGGTGADNLNAGTGSNQYKYTATGQGGSATLTTTDAIGAGDTIVTFTSGTDDINVAATASGTSATTSAAAAINLNTYGAVIVNTSLDFTAGTTTYATVVAALNTAGNSAFTADAGAVAYFAVLDDNGASADVYNIFEVTVGGAIAGGALAGGAGGDTISLIGTLTAPSLATGDFIL